MGPPPGDMGDHMGPPPGWIWDQDGMPPPPPDGMGDMDTDMADAGSHQGPEGPGPDGPPMP